MHEAGYVSDSIQRRILPNVKYIKINTCFVYPAEQNNTQIMHLLTAATTRWLQLSSTLVLLSEYGIQFTNEFIKKWKRFLDDCFIPWTKSKQELLDFEKMLNSLHTDIRFTMECSDKQLPF